MRYFIHLAYDGTNYHGWQIQPNDDSVQERLEFCLSKILSSEIKLTGCGRTDSGVHASQYYAHFDIENEISELDKLVFKVNKFLPNDISVYEIFKVNKEAHARFDAVSREYQYFFGLKKDPFRDKYAHRILNKLDFEKMHQVAQVLLEYTDFECFSKVHTEVNNFNCTLNYVRIEEQNGQMVFVVSANRFLRNMVRAIVGTLIEVGKGNWSEDDVRQIILSKDRGRAGSSVPAKALFLSKIEYDFNAIKS